MKNDFGLYLSLVTCVGILKRNEFARHTQPTPNTFTNFSYLVIDSNVYFWRENSNVYSIVNVARFGRNVVK